jgi:hypothetical protein
MTTAGIYTISPTAPLLKVALAPLITAGGDDDLDTIQPPLRSRLSAAASPPMHKLWKTHPLKQQHSLILFGYVYQEALAE